MWCFEVQCLTYSLGSMKWRETCSQMTSSFFSAKNISIQLFWKKRESFFAFSKVLWQWNQNSTNYPMQFFWRLVWEKMGGQALAISFVSQSCSQTEIVWSNWCWRMSGNYFFMPSYPFLKLKKHIFATLTTRKNNSFKQLKSKSIKIGFGREKSCYRKPTNEITVI